MFLQIRGHHCQWQKTLLAWRWDIVFLLSLDIDFYFLLAVSCFFACTALDFGMTEQLKIHCFDFMPRAQTEDNLRRRTYVWTQLLHPVLVPLPSASWHPFSRFTSFARLFAFSSPSHWTFIVFHYRVEEQERIFIWHQVCVFPHTVCCLASSGLCTQSVD